MPEPILPTAVYTKIQVDEMLQLSHKTMTELLNGGELVASKRGKHNWCILNADLLAYVQDRKVR